ncbi:MAG: tRNA (guanine-N1)-methyltransferase [Cyanothece sp. SIO1E1]|nr:tRNA (guanine-N1)-methyltransferase [Cyanothece sp. SIO1E1]
MTHLSGAPGEQEDSCAAASSSSAALSVQPSHWHQEGKARFRVGNAFYRAGSAIARDLAVLAAATYKATTGQLRVLDAMTGCGVRPLRYRLEAGADWVWANEGNPDLGPVLQQNLANGLEAGAYSITHLDANRVFFDCYQRRDYYDLVDVDSFGSAAPYVSTSLWATKIGGLLYLTSTDGRTSEGRHPDKSLAVYGAYARSHPAAHEQGLRLLLGSVFQQAAMKGLGIQPGFALFSGQVYRVMVRLVAKSNMQASLFGFLGYCHDCGHYQTVSWRRLNQAQCPCPDHNPPKPLTLSGPMWLGPLHDGKLLQQMEALATTWGWSTQTRLLQVMQAEAALPPYFLTLAEIGHHGQMDIPQRDRLIQALHAQGYRASLTHIDPQAIKTHATMAACLAIARQLSRD